MQRMVWAVLAAFAAALALGPFTIRALTVLKFGQNVYELAPAEHRGKQGTPTMGGLLFALICAVISILFRFGAFSLRTDFVLALLLFAALNLLIGFLDDLTKVRRKRNQGLSERQKLAAQFVIASAFSAYCYLHPQVGSSLYVPFFGVEFDLGWVYLPAMVFVILCTTNGANLLDGLDGLCGSVSAVVMSTFAVMALLLAATLGAGAEQDNLLSLGVCCAALAGALLGFLRFNLHPAQVIMGDTGSMFLGGMVVGAAMLLRLPLLIPLAAGAMAVSLLSVFLQRIYFTLTHGKRIFKMSPLHHHFELCGVEEPRIVSMYAIATVLLCLLSLLGIAR